MFPPKFTYYAPDRLDEAVEILDAGNGEAKLLAGGHSLLPMMKLRLAEPSALVDLRRVPGLSRIESREGFISVGAMTSHAEIEHSELLRGRLPLLPETAATIGDLQVRNRGTLGGSLAHADPAADLSAAALALEADLLLAGSAGRRVVRSTDFFLGLFTTQLRTDEVLVEVQFPPLPPGAGTAYLKFPHPASRFALCGVAVVVLLAEDGRVAQARVAVTGVAAATYRARSVEEALVGLTPGPETLGTTSELAAKQVQPLEDLHASAAYRAHLARVFCRRTLEKAFQRARTVLVRSTSAGTEMGEDFRTS